MYSDIFMWFFFLVFSKAKSFPKDPLKAPGLIEFEHLFWREHFRRQTKLKRERRKLVFWSLLL